ncbi:thiamine biosynthesis protein ThiF [Sphingomonas mucosissima]|uniref:Thiamine biosynthesis protein ThiF n=2 Tax=Sphingomonas mucosissima TaxID=370959 RepID=A0A245ZRH0_9SPHN|nr:thiamine biosynthesis protein ThiF [Sphingomonas mucosissima]
MADGGDEPVEGEIVAEPDLVQLLEMARVLQSPGVVASSIELRRLDEGEILTFDIMTEPTVEEPAADVREIERIHFVYREGHAFGRAAPYNVLCDRNDFPRKIGHLCSGEPGCRAAPCLALGGIQPIYERAGIEAIMTRLRDFLRDAKTGTLMMEGWEPVPFGVGQKLRMGQIEPRVFQEHALANPGAGSAVGVAINFDDDDRKQVSVFSQILERHDVIKAIGYHNGNFGGKRHAIPWLFVWREPSAVERDPLFENWRTGAELLEGMRAIGVDRAFDAAVGDLLTKEVDFRCHRPPLGGRAMVVIIGVWRPAPIMDAFFGYSKDPAARRLELRAFLISQDRDKNILDADTRIETIVGDYPPRPSLMRWVAGVDLLPPVALLGHGALGSAIHDNLARSGMEDVLVWDKDRIHPHNLARHSARMKDIYANKADQAKRLADALWHEDGKSAVVHDDIATADIDELKARTEGRLVIDATADERVRLRMDELSASPETTVIRTEMFHQGRLGMTFMSPPGGPTMSDMMLATIALAPDNGHVAAWLNFEDRDPLGPDPLLYGFGCTSMTVHLPKHAVEQHASVACTAILGDRSEAGILLNPLDDRFRPTGSRWVPMEPFTILQPASADDWQIRVSPSAVAAMTAERIAALPTETGGYLYGSWDPTRRVITIVHASSLPPGSQANETRLELGKAGGTLAERRFTRLTRGRIYLCGTWHSHPDGSAHMSGRDHRAMTAHADRDAPELRPTLMVIVAQDDIQAHLRLP